jgi:hypothetical protein
MVERLLKEFDVLYHETRLDMINDRLNIQKYRIYRMRRARLRDMDGELFDKLHPEIKEMHLKVDPGHLDFEDLQKGLLQLEKFNFIHMNEWRRDHPVGGRGRGRGRGGRARGAHYMAPRLPDIREVEVSDEDYHRLNPNSNLLRPPPPVGGFDDVVISPVIEKKKRKIVYDDKDDEIIPLGKGVKIIDDDDSNDIMVVKKEFNKVVSPSVPVEALSPKVGEVVPERFVNKVNKQVNMVSRGYIPYYNKVQKNYRRINRIPYQRVKGAFCNFMKRLNYKRRKLGKDCFREVGGLLIFEL